MIPRRGRVAKVIRRRRPWQSAGQTERMEDQYVIPKGVKGPERGSGDGDERAVARVTRWQMQTTLSNSDGARLIEHL